VTAAAWICLFAPAAAVVVIALAGMRINGFTAGVIASGATGISFVCALIAFFSLLGEGAEEREHTSTLWTWLSAGDLRFGAEITIDPLSVFMMLVVSGVGFLILSYAVGYLQGDDEERRYHAYKALFVFSMLLLVQSGNLLLLLAGWGMVGLSSYLLINFWHFRRTAVEAGKKAFIMNAVGDATSARSTSTPSSRGRPRRWGREARRPSSSRSASWVVLSPSRRRCRSTPGSRTRWRAPPPSRRSSTRRRW
jgi:NADH-quinone oxidoreductase subunit L